MYKFPEAQSRLDWELKTGSIALGEAPYFHEFYLQENHQVFIIKSEENSLVFLEVKEGSNNFFKIPEQFFLLNNLISKEIILSDLVFISTIFTGIGFMGFWLT